MTETTQRRPRIDSVDLLRGIVMVVMLLDHTRDFVHYASWQFDPTDLTRTNPALFFTRWVTHFCAPIFVFLAGTGAWFQLSRGKSKAELSKFLLKRGLWLIVLEFTAVRLLAYWDFSIQFAGVAQVIWVLGVCMIALAGLIHLPLRAIVIFGLSMVVMHNALDPIDATQWQGPGSPVPSALDKLWLFLHDGGFFPVAGWPSPVIFVLYPLIPWFGVMALGFAFGKVYDWPAEDRRRALLRWGIAATVGFVVLRLLNIYGNPSDWTIQKTTAMTIVSFFNVQKYPPSLLFLMMTLGPAMIALSMWDRLNNGETQTGLKKALITYGRVPLFFYLLQWPTAHAAGLLLTLAVGKDPGHYFREPGPGQNVPPDAGFDLWVVYVAWIAGALLLYPVCRWYASVKARRRDWWLSYL
jgi:uncharacterized membrane protein